MTKFSIGDCRYEIREDLNGAFHVLDLVNHRRLATFNQFKDAMTFAKQAALKTAQGKSDE
jgi:hypothetical protein